MTEQEEKAITQEVVDTAWAEAFKFGMTGIKPHQLHIEVCKATVDAFTNTLKKIEAEGKAALVHPDYPAQLVKRMEEEK